MTKCLHSYMRACPCWAPCLSAEECVPRTHGPMPYVYMAAWRHVVSPTCGRPRDAGVGASRPLLDGAGEGGRTHPRRRTATSPRSCRGSDVETEWGCLTLERMRSPYTRLAWAPRRDGTTRSAGGRWVSNPALPALPPTAASPAPTAATPIIHSSHWHFRSQTGGTSQEALSGLVYYKGASGRHLRARDPHSDSPASSAPLDINLRGRILSYLRWRSRCRAPRRSP